MSQSNTPAPAASDRIDEKDQADLARWSERLNVTEDQLKDAVAQVGNLASDVELYLKGSRSSTNDDKVERLS